jgi:hypothetical protein
MSMICLACVLLQLAPSEDFNTPTLTTNQGAPVDDVEHSMTAGDSGERLAGQSLKSKDCTTDRVCLNNHLFVGTC